MRVDVVGQVLPIDALDVGGGSQDGHAQWGALIGHSVEVVKYHLLNLLVHLLHLSQDNATFPLNLVGPQFRVLD